MQIEHLFVDSIVFFVVFLNLYRLFCVFISNFVAVAFDDGYLDTASSQFTVLAIRIVILSRLNLLRNIFGLMSCHV